MSDRPQFGSQDTLDKVIRPSLPGDDSPEILRRPPEKSKIRQRFGSLKSPFKNAKALNLGAVKRTGSLKSDWESDGSPKPTAERRKKNKKLKPSSQGEIGCENDGRTGKKKGVAGAFVRKFGGLGRSKKGDEDGSERSSAAEGSSPSLSSETASAPLATVESADLDGSDGEAKPEPVSENDRSPELEVRDVSVEHPVSTLPFAKSTWKKQRSMLERPLETPSSDDALRRRIAFVAQATVAMSDDKPDQKVNLAHGAMALQQMVELARQRLTQTSSPMPPTNEDRDTDECDEFEEAVDDPPPPASALSTATPVLTKPSSQARRMSPAPYGDLFLNSEPDMGQTLTSSHPATPGGERREHLYKILVIGELGTGKTSIIKRYVHQFFSQHYRATIGVDFALKVLNWDANTIIRLQLWDIAGQERFGNMTRVYYKEAVGAFIVFDVARAATFDAVVKWKQDLDSKVQLPDGSPIPCILLANKCDQQKEGIVNTPSKMEEYCRERGFSGWFETSAKENINIDEAARTLVNKILVNDKLIRSSDSTDSDKINLDGRSRANGGTDSRDDSKCAC